MHFAVLMKCHLNLAVLSYRESRFPICDFNYKAWFWQHVITPELSYAMLSCYMQAMSIFYKEPIPKVVIVSEKLQGTEPQQKQATVHRRSLIRGLTIKVFVYSTILIASRRTLPVKMLPTGVLFPDFTRITIAFLVYKPRFLFYFILPAFWPGIMH